MNDLTKKPTISSLRIAEVCAKPHKEVLEAIRAMEPAWTKVCGRRFALTRYRDEKGGMRTLYQLDKNECLYVTARFDNETRAKLAASWEQSEQRTDTAFRIPQSYAEALRLAAEQAERTEIQREQIESMQAKALFADAVSASDRSCLIAELAKILRQNGVVMGQNRLYEWLRRNGYLCSRGEYHNLPTQKSMEMGLFEVKKTSISRPDGAVRVTTTPKVTGKGQVYFVNKFLGGIRP